MSLLALPPASCLQAQVLVNQGDRGEPPLKGIGLGTDTRLNSGH